MRHAVTGAIALAASALLIGSCSSKMAQQTTTGSGHTEAPATPPTLTAQQQVFVSAMRAKWKFTSGISDREIATYGAAVCKERSEGGAQTQAQDLARTTWTNESATDAYKMTRLAESDLCPPQLPAVRWHTLAVYSGQGIWNSAPFHIHPGPSALRVSYSYSGNSLGGMADNFVADLVSNSDDLQLVNDIAVSGAKTTMQYPDLTLGDRAYHLEVQAADGSWTFKIMQRW